MKLEVEEQYFDEDLEEWGKRTKTLNVPEELPGNVGDKANKKLDARMDIDQQANNGRESSQNITASTRIKSSKFQEVTEYLVKEMIQNYNRGDPVDIEKLTDSSQKEVARYYFDQLEVFGSKKKDNE